MPGTRIARAFVVLVAIAALVAAAAVLRVARIDSLRSSSGAADGTLRALIRALAKEPTRPIEGRLASPIPYAAAALEVKRDPAVDVRLAVLDLEKLAMQDQTPEHDAALGAAYLSIGEIDRAVKHLEQASFASPDVESLQNDLGAAYLARARASARMDDLPRALSAAEHALSISPALLAARFNRALALEHLWLRDAAVAAWEEYVHIDASSAWASEARKHLVVLRMATATYRSLDLTGVSPCVTQFVGRFQQGLMASLRDVRTACPVDPRDESSSGWAAFLEAVGAFYAGDRDGSERVAHKGLSRSRQPQTRGRLLYVLAANEFARGAFPTALDLLTQARALFTSQHDSDGAISVSQMVAEVLRALGERDAAWEHYIRALELVSGAPPSVRTHALLTSVAVASLSQSYPNLAINALNLAEKNASGPSRAAELTDVYLNRARAWSQLGDATSATRDLHAAEAQISYVDDTQIQSRLVAELGSARSEVLVNSEPDNALRAAIQAGDYYRRLGIVFREANVHLSAARAQTRRGDRAAAREQLLQGIDVIEGERARLAEQRARISHLDRVWDLYRDYVELAVADGDDVSALAMLERSRARHTGGVAVDIDSLRRELSTDAVGLVFFQGDGWIGRWTVTRNGIAFTRVPMSAADVAREVGRLRAAILSGTVDAAGNPPTNLVPCVNRRSASRCHGVPSVGRRSGRTSWRDSVRRAAGARFWHPPD